jgi:hypothetical protein
MAIEFASGMLGSRQCRVAAFISAATSSAQMYQKIVAAVHPAYRSRVLRWRIDRGGRSREVRQGYCRAAQKFAAIRRDPSG